MKSLSPMARSRAAAGLTQANVASILGIDQPTISRWETGHADVRVPALRRLSVLYRCPVGQLID